MFHSYFFFFGSHFLGRNVMRMVCSRNGVFTRSVMTLLVFLPPSLLFFKPSPSASCFYIIATVLSGGEKTPHLTAPTHTRTQRRLLKPSPQPRYPQHHHRPASEPLTLLRSDLMGREAQEEAPRYRCPRSLVFQCVFSRLIPGKWRVEVPR